MSEEVTLGSLTKQRGIELHTLLTELKNFVRLNYDPRDKPPAEEEIDALSMYIERVINKMP